MKSILLSLFISLTLFGCEKVQSEHESITGIGPLHIEERTVYSFSKIENRLAANIRILKSNSRKIEVKAQKNLISGIHTTVLNGSLIISSGDYSSITDSTISIDLYIPDSELEELSMKGSGLVWSECPVKRIYLSGAGNISCSGEISHTEVLLSGFGNINLLDMKVATADIRISGNGNVKMNADEKLDISIPGMGNVYYKGNPEINQSISGMGNIINL